MSSAQLLVRSLIAACAFAIAVPGDASAVLREFSMTGAVTGVDDDAGVFGGMIEVGTPYTSSFHYHDEGLRGSSGVPNSIHYHYDVVGSAFGLSIDIGPHSFGTNPNGLSEFTIDDGHRDHDFFWLSIGSVLSDDFDVHRIDFRLEDPSMTVFSTALPPASLDVADFSERSVTIIATGQTSFVILDVQTIVPIPEPSTALCLMLGLGLLACRRNSPAS